MLRFSSRPLALVAALAFTVTSADAAQRRAKPEPPPPQFKVDGPTRPMAMERIALTIPENVTVATVKIFSAQAGEYRDVALSVADFFPGTPTANYVDIFTKEATLAGYQLAGRQGSSDLFNSVEEKRPELIIGAAITGLTAGGSFVPNRIFGPDSTIEGTVTIDWQVFDPLEKRLIYRITNKGNAKLERQSIETNLPAEMALEAFRDASKSILADPGFVVALKLPAAASTEGPSEEGAALAAAPIGQVPRLPLRSAPFREHIPELRHQVVTVITGDGIGSGFYVADGLIMTNHHVIEGHRSVKIRFFGGREIPGEVVASHARRDVAMVKAPGGGMLGLPIQFDRPQIGAPVYVIGTPRSQDLEGTVTAGIVSAYRLQDDGPILQSDVVVNQGNSGGPMFDDKGNVVALVVAGRVEKGVPIGLNFFIPVDDAFRSLGISVAGLTPAPARMEQLAAAGGRLIQVSMYPAAGPLQKSGKVQPITGNVGGVGGAGTFAFTRHDGVTCDGKWTTLQAKPASGSLLDKHRDVVGIAANPEGMVGGLAIGVCSNGGSFQAEYYVVPNVDSGFGAATDSDGNIYKVIF